MPEKKQNRFNLNTMSGIYPGTRTQVFQRVVLGKSVSPNARLAWYTEPVACMVTQDDEETPLLQLDATLETDAGRSTFWANLLDGLEKRNAQLRTCGTCSHYDSAAAQGADGLVNPDASSESVPLNDPPKSSESKSSWYLPPDGFVSGRCGFGTLPATDYELARQSVLGLACVHWRERTARIMWSSGTGIERGSKSGSSQQVGEAARAATEAGDGGVLADPSFSSRADTRTEENQEDKKGDGVWATLKRLVGPRRAVSKSQSFEERSGVGAGTEPCFACEGRLANLGSLVTQTDEGDAQTFSVWRCRVCYTFYLNNWIDRWERLDNLETEEVYYRLAPSEAITLLGTIESKAVSLEQVTDFVESRSPLSHQIKHGR